MTSKKTTRRALFSSVIALILCCSMLVGTTFAWFTDEVKSMNNVITAGNLDVDVVTADGNSIQNQATLFDEITYWEPGVVAYETLTVKNVGSLALSYRMSLLFEALNYVEHEGVQYDLTDVLKVGVLTEAVDSSITREQLVAKVTEWDLLSSFTEEGELYPVGNADNKATEEVFTVVIYWQPGNNDIDNLYNMNNGTAPNEGKELKVNLGVNVFATQLEYESDSFDELYDEAADRIIAEGETVYLTGPDINESVVNHGTVNVEGGIVDNDSYALDNRGTANLEDVTVNAGNPTNYALIARGPDAVTNMDNVDLNAAGGGVAAASGATVYFNSGSVDVNTTSTSGRYLFYAEGAGSKIVINGGTFDFNRTQNQKRAYIYASAGTTVIVNGGTFGKASTRSGYTDGIMGDGTVIIYGGTFGFNPTKWVAPGYKATQDGSIWTVGPQITDATDLKNALNNGEDVTLVEDFNLNADESNAYGKTGINVTNGQTIDGNGNTLSVTGANGTWDSAVNITSGTIKNLTIDSGFRGVFVNHNGTGGHVTLDNVIIDGPVYTISCDQGTNSGLTAINSTFNGWTSYAATIGNVKFDGCSFGEGSGYAFCRPYAPTEFVGCDFEAGFELDARAVVTFENCYLDGVLITAENLATLVTSNIANASVK